MVAARPMEWSCGCRIGNVATTVQSVPLDKVGRRHSEEEEGGKDVSFFLCLGALREGRHCGEEATTSLAFPPGEVSRVSVVEESAMTASLPAAVHSERRGARDHRQAPVKQQRAVGPKPSLSGRYVRSTPSGPVHSTQYLRQHTVLPLLEALIAFRRRGIWAGPPSVCPTQ